MVKGCPVLACENCATSTRWTILRRKRTRLDLVGPGCLRPTCIADHAESIVEHLFRWGLTFIGE
jgi:hypothetical protein